MSCFYATYTDLTNTSLLRFSRKAQQLAFLDTYPDAARTSDGGPEELPDGYKWYRPAGQGHTAGSVLQIINMLDGEYLATPTGQPYAWRKAV